DMTVISRNTAFTYADKQIDTPQVGRELNVRYVLQGSFRRAGARIRVNAQLIDAETDAHVWADRFDHDAEDLFALQDEVTSRIAVALNIELIGAEAARPTNNADALDHILRGRAALYRGPTRQSFTEAIGHLTTALALDPGSVQAKALLADALAERALDQLSATVEADLSRAEALVAEAQANSASSLVYFAKGQI